MSPLKDWEHTDTDGLKCPKCSSVDDFGIEIASIHYFDADGLYDRASCDGNFRGANLCICLNDDCGYESIVFDFLIEKGGKE